MAYADYNDLMDMTEHMISELVKSVTGDYVIKFHPDGPGTEKIVEINFKPPWKRISMMEELAIRTKSKFPENLDSEEAIKIFEALLKEHHVDCPPPRTPARMIDKLVGHFIEVDCLNPTFLIDHPQLMSPLAKYHRSKPGLTERFELFVNHHELCNAYTELNDPFVQK